jgi:hypothetical protein
MNELSKFAVIWPDVFETGEARGDDSPEWQAAACADGLMGWALAMAGNPPPKNFGAVMVALGDKAHCTPTVDGFSERARALGFLGGGE